MCLCFLLIPLLALLLPSPVHMAVPSYSLCLPLVQMRTCLIAAKW